METSKRRAMRHAGYSWQQITTLLRGIEQQQAMAVWEWSAVRYSSLGTAQARHFKRYGAASTFARINRVRAWLDLAPIV